jgi:multidrug resistance efflux pump
MDKNIQIINSNKFPKFQKNLAIAASVILVIISVVGGLIYLHITRQRVYIEKAEISAPKIELAPTSAAALEDTFVKEGDMVSGETLVARVGNELIKTKIPGIIISVKNDFGKIFLPNETVVSLISPDEMRVIGQLEENKGLKDIKTGQHAIFKVDAFPKNTYYGVVDEVSPTSREGDVIFNISDKRQIKEFNVKIIFDIHKYPELKNGMSAKIWIYK